MKGPISISLGRFLNAYGIREPVQFNGFNDTIQTEIDVEKFYVRNNAIGLEVLSALSISGTTSGILQGGTVPSVPQGELWMVEGVHWTGSVVAGDTIDAMGMIAGTLPGQLNRHAAFDRCTLLTSANDQFFYSGCSTPFLMSPGESFGIAISSLDVTTVFFNIDITYWPMILG